MVKKKASSSLPAKGAMGKKVGGKTPPSIPYPDLEEYEKRHQLLTVDPGVPYEKQSGKKE